MAKTIYIQEGSDVVKKIIEDSVIDFSTMIQTYQDLKSRYQNLPQLKTVADAETLAFFNEAIDREKNAEETYIRNEAKVLYDELTIIRDEGLLPVQYENEYQTLKTFVEGV